MTNPNDNAFPMVVSEASSEAHNGLTKRELFAALIYAFGDTDLDPDCAVRSADAIILALNHNNPHT